MPFIEVTEHTTGQQARPRRFYVNVARIAYISGQHEQDHAAITFDDRTLSIVVDETWIEVQRLIDQAEGV